MKKIALLLLAALSVAAFSFTADAAPKKAKKGKKVVIAMDFNAQALPGIKKVGKAGMISEGDGETYIYKDAKTEKEYGITLFCNTGGYGLVKMGDGWGLGFNWNNDSRGNAYIKTPVVEKKALKRIEFSVLNKFKKYVVVSSGPNGKGDVVRRTEMTDAEPATLIIAEPEVGKAYYIWSGDKNIAFANLILTYE